MNTFSSIISRRDQEPIVVQKYGGTSVGNVDRIAAVATRTARWADAGTRRLALVVSAMAGETNRLLELVSQANRKASARTYDLAASVGEQVTVALVAAALEKLGLKPCPLLSFQLGIVTDSSFSRARIQKIDTKKIHDAWARDEIPIIAGYQGVTEDLSLTTLGRGGSDTSAVALAVALGAEFCEINTDVDGVYSSDPRVVESARLIQKMDFNVALEMSALGSKVLHSRCVELAAKYRMPLFVRNTFKAEDSQTTLITNLTDRENLESPVVSGVSVEKMISRISVASSENDYGLISRLFSVLADAGINVDVIVHDRSHSGVRVGFTVSEAQSGLAIETLRNLTKGSDRAKTEISQQDDLAKVSVIGLGMQSNPGVAARVFARLVKNAIDTVMISTSEIKISCVIPASKAEIAANELHAEFIDEFPE